MQIPLEGDFQQVARKLQTKEATPRWQSFRATESPYVIVQN